MSFVMKAPGAELDWPISYTLAVGETITTSTWTVAPVEAGGVTVKAGTPSIAAGVTSCILTGGNFRDLYDVANTVLTSQGRTYQQTVTLRIGPMVAT